MRVAPYLVALSASVTVLSQLVGQCSVIWVASNPILSRLQPESYRP